MVWKGHRVGELGWVWLGFFGGVGGCGMNPEYTGGHH